MICRYVRVPSPVVFFFLTASVAWARRRVVAVTLPARLSENKSLVKVGQRKGTFFFFFMLVFAPLDNTHTPSSKPIRAAGRKRQRKNLLMARSDVGGNESAAAN